MKPDSILFLAFLTATASAVYIVENLIMSMLPIPFIRIGLSNVVLLYLVYHRRILSAFVVAIAKSVIGPCHFHLYRQCLRYLWSEVWRRFVMSMGLFIRPRFSMFGISVLGAIGHNTAQLLLVNLLFATWTFCIVPILILLGLISGIITAYLCLYRG